MTPPFFGRPKAHLRALICAWILAWLPSAPALAAKAAGAAEVAAAADFAADARLARERRLAIVVLYTRDGCSWCALVRERHLAPLLRDPQSAGRVLIREVGLDNDARLTDFDGRATTQAGFGRARAVRLAPTLEFLDARGQRLVEPIVGVLLPDFYGAFIDRAIDESLAKLRAASK